MKLDRTTAIKQLNSSGAKGRQLPATKRYRKLKPGHVPANVIMYAGKATVA
jgi:hypothetical protein